MPIVSAFFEREIRCLMDPMFRIHRSSGSLSGLGLGLSGLTEESSILLLSLDESLLELVCV